MPESGIGKDASGVECSRDPHLSESAGIRAGAGGHGVVGRLQEAVENRPGVRLAALLDCVREDGLRPLRDEALRTVRPQRASGRVLKDDVEVALAALLIELADEPKRPARLELIAHDPFAARQEPHRVAGCRARPMRARRAPVRTASGGAQCHRQGDERHRAPDQNHRRWILSRRSPATRVPSGPTRPVR